MLIPATCIYFSFRIVHSKRSSDGHPQCQVAASKVVHNDVLCGQRYPNGLITSLSQSDEYYLTGKKLPLPCRKASPNIRISRGISFNRQSVISQFMLMGGYLLQTDTVHIIKGFRQSGRTDIIRCAGFKFERKFIESRFSK